MCDLYDSILKDSVLSIAWNFFAEKDHFIL